MRLAGGAIVGALRRRLTVHKLRTMYDAVHPCRGGAPRSESKSNDRRGRSHHNITDSIRPPTWQVFEQNRIGRTGVPMLQNIPCFDIVPPNFVCKCSMVHCRRIAPTLFPPWGNNRAANSRPYADVPHRTLCVFCGLLKIFEFVGVVLRAVRATELPPQKFRCTNEVLKDTLY